MLVWSGHSCPLLLTLPLIFDLKFLRGMLRANFLQVARVKVIDEAKYHAIGT